MTVFWAIVILLALYLFLTLGGREYFDASTRPKNASLWQDSTGAYTAYWEPPDTDNTYSFQLLMSDGSSYNVGASQKPYQTYQLGQRQTVGFEGTVGLTDVSTGKSSGYVAMKNISMTAGQALIAAAGGTPPAATASPVSSTTPSSTSTSTSTSRTTPTVTTPSAPLIPNAQIPAPSASSALGASSLISGIAGVLLNPESSTIITTGQIPIGDIGQPSQIYEYNNGYAAFAASANLFGDSLNQVKTDMQSTGNEYNVSVISDNGIQYTFPLAQITSVTSSTNGDVVAYNLINTTHPKGNNMFTGNGARSVGLEITLVGPPGTASDSASSSKNTSPLTSSVNALAPPTPGSVGTTLNAPTNAPTYGPAGVGSSSSLNATIPPMAPTCNSSSSSSSNSNIVPKSSLVPCSCATTGSASCSMHQGSTQGSTVPGQPCSSLVDPMDTISALTKTQRQWDLMRPFNTSMGDIPGYLNSFSAFG